MTSDSYLDDLASQVAAMAPMEGVTPPPSVPEVAQKPAEGHSAALMEKIRRSENWHTNMLQLTAHWVGRKWSDAEILAMAGHLTTEGYTVAQTAAEMQAMIESARQKWNAANPDHAVDEKVPLVSMTLGDFLGLQIPPREIIVTPIIPSQGLVMVYAIRGIGKTYVSLSIALAVATGSSTLGGRWVADKARRVLFVDGEMPAVVLQERLTQLSESVANKLPEPDYLRIITPDQQKFGIPDLATDEGQAAIEAHLEGVELLILDNLSSLLRNGRENDADCWIPIQNWLLSLRRRGISVLIVHHAGKGGNQRGTSKKEDLLDTVIMLKRTEDYDAEQGAQFEVHYEKARGFFGDEAKAFDARLGTDERKKLQWQVRDIENSLLEPVRELNARGLSQREIAKELGVSASKVNRILKLLKSEPPAPAQEEIKFNE